MKSRGWVTMPEACDSQVIAGIAPDPDAWPAIREGKRAMKQSSPRNRHGWKQHWREFKEGRPGHRFQERYERNRKTGSRRSPALRTLKPIAGALLLIAGIVFCLIPGPGLPLLLLGVAFLADVSRRVAAALDRTELWLRSLLTRARRAWRKTRAT